MRTGRLLLIILIVIISACSFLFVFSNPVLKFLASGLVVNQQIVKSDAVLVLGGGSPSRVLEAVDIINEGYANKVLITRGGKPEGADYLKSRDINFPEEADLNKFVAQKLGINKNDMVLIPERVYSTKEEAEVIKEFALTNNYKSIVITTSKSHSRRALLIFQKVFKNTGIKITIKPSKYDGFDPEGLDKNKNYWKEVVLEYQKMLYFYAGEVL